MNKRWKNEIKITRYDDIAVGYLILIVLLFAFQIYNVYHIKKLEETISRMEAK